MSDAPGVMSTTIPSPIAPTTPSLTVSEGKQGQETSQTSGCNGKSNRQDGNCWNNQAGGLELRRKGTGGTERMEDPGHVMEEEVDSTTWFLTKRGTP